MVVRCYSVGANDSRCETLCSCWHLGYGNLPEIWKTPTSTPILSNTAVFIYLFIFITNRWSNRLLFIVWIKSSTIFIPCESITLIFSAFELIVAKHFATRGSYQVLWCTNLTLARQVCIWTNMHASSWWINSATHKTMLPANAHKHTKDNQLKALSIKWVGSLWPHWNQSTLSLIRMNTMAEIKETNQTSTFFVNIYLETFRSSTLTIVVQPSR